MAKADGAGGAVPFNPIVFNVKAEKYCKEGTEKLVGSWLALVSASIFGMVVLGGYTRLTKSGLSMVRWEPHRMLPPITQEEWEKEFEEYKLSPEWIQVNSKKGMDLSGFKYIFFWEWAHRMLGKSIGFTFFVPLTYFLARGYIARRMQKVLVGLLLFGGLQGAIGWWMVKSGLTDKKETGEVDKTPRVSPYRLSVHAGLAYTLYAFCFWNTMNLLRRPQEQIVNTLQKVGQYNKLRFSIKAFSFTLLPLVLLTGFFTAGTCAGYSCNTFPWVGEHWFYNRNHFLSRDEVPLWKNFTENKLICQVNHRTLASIMTIWATVVGLNCLRLTKLSGATRLSIVFLLSALWGQLFLGMNVIWNNVPIHLASLHQIGAMTTLTAVLFACHNARAIDNRHMLNLIGKLRIEDPVAYKNLMKQQSRMMNFSGA